MLRTPFRRPAAAAAFCAAFAVVSTVQARPIKVERLRGVRALAAAGDAQEMEATQGEALVHFATATTSYSDRAAKVSLMGGSILEEIEEYGLTVVGLPPGMSVLAGIDKLSDIPGVLEAWPNVIYRPMKLPNDPLAFNQYHLNKINAFAAWEFDVGDSTTVTVGVIDAGIDFTHPDLSAKQIAGQNADCQNAGCTAGDTTVACNHGTRVAGVAAASSDNGRDVAGVSWGAKLLSLRVFDACDTQCATCVTNETRLMRAIDHARTSLNGAPGINKMVLNMSIGGTCECGRNFDLITNAASAGCGGADAGLPAAIANAANAGIILVASAGNYSNSAGGGPVMSPANCANVIPVGATDENDNVAGFSARGSSLAAHGVVAPGVNVLTTDLSANTASANGTSFASPIVAGIAALILSANPAISTASVKNAIRNSAEGIGVSALGAQGSAAGAGRVNAFKAMRLALGKGAFEGDEKAIAFPNPFKPATHGTATVTVPAGLQGKNPHVRFYTMDGQLVRDLGANTTWDGKNAGGRPVATGTYIFLVETDAGKERGRLAVIR